ncbi:MAG TPA: MotA/TolQ/ExbB proton channel family protein [Candidatus Acidoferrum sp.]|nr:MotA/TolQ/ExbB proton channel family protein [Candidatus Acidoferrum sp.]
MLQLFSLKRALAISFVGLGLASASVMAQQISVEELMNRIRAERTNDQNVTRDRENRFRTEMDEQRKQTAKVQADKATADAKTKRLDAEYADNEKKIKELNELLKVNQGNLGELFGVTRQVAGDTLSTFSASLVTTQLDASLKKGQETRLEFMRNLGAAKKLPNIADLERMWTEMLTEMKAGGETVRYNAPVMTGEGDATQDMEVVRVASFMAYGADKYLLYLPSKSKLSTLERQPADGSIMSSASKLLKNTSETGYMEAVIDPARGALLSQYVERPNMWERIRHGEVVVYVTLALGIIGVVLAVFQYFYLIMAKMNVSAQLKRMATPMKNNALGRMLLSVSGADGHGADKDRPEVVELRISESVLREIPKLERFQSFLRLAVAAGPLLGLIGTVIGMINTFQSITASGTSDPKLMANGIGQAMIATVMGLGVAIPLLFINSGLVALSKSVIHVLEEESSSLLAKKLRQQQH